jgi:ABC-type cobalamin/Fe3+-siderophores transport system ATPase subunit
MTSKGKMIAMTVASLFATSPLLAADPPKEAKIRCELPSDGKNSCSGPNGCGKKTIVDATEKECKAKGGKVATAEPKKDEKKDDAKK